MDLLSIPSELVVELFVSHVEGAGGGGGVFIHQKAGIHLGNPTPGAAHMEIAPMLS